MISLLIAIIYLCFISLGLPDSLLGSAWPSMYPELGVSISWAGVITMVIALCTIISSLMSDYLTKKLGSHLVTFISILLTALALLGFSLSNKLFLLIIIAIPYGLGAGAIDAALNNYVALHFKAKHMSWLHCMWGLGASISPYIIGYALSRGTGWHEGYLIVGIIQIIISFIVLISIPLWKKQININNENEKENSRAIKFKEIINIPGAIPCFIMFFCYCTIEQTTMLWGSSYLVLHQNVSPTLAASFASLFLIGLTIGRGINGFLTMKFDDHTLIRTGLIMILIGVIVLIFSPILIITIISLILIGLGCAPIYPSIIHMTPSTFGADKSQALIGVQMASAYVGTCLMPPIFGLLIKYLNIKILPLYLLIFTILMITMHEVVIKKTASLKRRTL